MKIETFALERMQSTWENVVELNLAESGVHPLDLDELLTPAEIDELRRLRLGYSQSNGTPELRGRIAALYPGAGAEQILVTAGSTEANFLLMWSLIEPGDEVVFEMPNYLQMRGLLRAFGARVRTFSLREENGWAPDLDELDRAVTPKTKIVVLTNPHNPTGAVLTRAEMEAVVRIAGRAGAWILADEVYRGAERTVPPTPSFWGLSDRVVSVGGVSKAYGLAGLRIGWLAAPPELVRTVWRYHDYTTISPSALGDRLAALALAPGRAERLLGRARAILEANYPVLAAWLESRGCVFDHVPPKAGAVVFARYDLDINSTALAERLIREGGVFVVPGDLFERDHWLRIGFGGERARLEEALARFGRTLDAL